MPQGRHVSPAPNPWPDGIVSREREAKDNIEKDDLDEWKEPGRA